jgi:chromosome segregation ATPase
MVVIYCNTESLLNEAEQKIQGFREKNDSLSKEKDSIDAERASQQQEMQELREVSEKTKKLLEEEKTRSEKAEQELASLKEKYSFTMEDNDHKERELEFSASMKHLSHGPASSLSVFLMCMHLNGPPRWLLLLLLFLLCVYVSYVV